MDLNKNSFESKDYLWTSCYVHYLCRYLSFIRECYFGFILKYYRYMLKNMSERQDLPKGIWEIVANGHRGELNIIKVDDDGQIAGDVTFGIGTPNEYTNKIFGLWDANAWKITFLRQNELEWKDPENTPIPNTGHGRDQVYTGYMWKGTTGPPPPPYLYCLAGSFIAFGGSMGTGGTKDRSEFGWVATFPSSTSRK
jgi:hypothetical protein